MGDLEFPLLTVHVQEALIVILNRRLPLATKESEFRHQLTPGKYQLCTSGEPKDTCHGREKLSWYTGSSRALDFVRKGRLS